MNEKKKRLDILKQLIASNTASNQEDILSMLAENGFCGDSSDPFQRLERA